MLKNKKISFLIFFIVLSSVSFADDYNSAIGLWKFDEISGPNFSDSAGSRQGILYDGTGLKASFNMTYFGGNAYGYQDLTSVTDYTITAGSYLEYDVMWTSTDDRIAFDYTLTDGGTLRDARMNDNSGTKDQNGVGAHPASNLSSYAVNQWYHRKIALPESHVGRTIGYYDIACEVDYTSTKTAYLKNVAITDGSGNVRKNIYNGESYTSAVHHNSSGVANFGSGYEPVPGYNATVAGKFGNALDLDGVNDYIGINTSSLNLNNYTLSCWVKPEIQGAGNRQGLMLLQNPGGDALRLFIDPYNIQHDIVPGEIANLATSFNLNEWSLITATFDGTTTKLYKNGILQSQAQAPMSFLNTSYISFGWATADKTLQGAMDDTAIWNRALDANEIASLYQVSVETYETIASTINNVWNFDYSTEELNALTTLYSNGKAGLNPIDILVGGTPWKYYGGLLPGDDGNRAIGDSWIYEGQYYIKLGSGIGTAIPEPATAILLGFIIVLYFWQRNGIRQK